MKLTAKFHPHISLINQESHLSIFHNQLYFFPIFQKEFHLYIH